MKSVVFSDADAGMTGYFTILYCLRSCSFCFPGSRLAMYQGDLILAPEAFVYKTSSRGSLISLTFRESFFTEDLRKELKDCTVLSRFLPGRREPGSRRLDHTAEGRGSQEPGPS